VVPLLFFREIKYIMRKVFGFVLIIIGFLSCAKDSEPSGDLNGTYNGLYLATGDLKDTGLVKIVFVGSNFSGESVGTSRPICNGSYQIFQDSIDFKNLCSTPDPELLLVGKFKITSVGDSLYFTRIFNGSISYEEQFSLLKQ
jgi:hypothetical protein